jgi:hypothetical protein
MPLAQGLNGLFVLTFMLLIRRGLWSALLGSLLVWFIEATFLYRLDIQSFLISLMGWLLLLFFCYFVLEKWMKISSRGKLEVSYPPSQLIWRALFGGAVIALAVFMGRLGGSLLGGIFSSFPAMFLSTLIITYNTGGSDYSRSVGKSLVISGLINVPLYEILVRFLYPNVGLGLGTLIAVLFSLGMGYLTYIFMKSRLS